MSLVGTRPPTLDEWEKRNGFKSIVKNIFMVQYDSKRRLRIKRFDEFRKNCLILSDGAMS